MTRELHITDATQADITELIANVRDEDHIEIEMLDPVGFVRDHIQDSFDESAVCLAVRSGENLLCCCGVAQKTLLSQTACIWSIGTQYAGNHPFELVRATRPALSSLMERTPATEVYMNIIPTTYTGYIKWAERCLDAHFTNEVLISPAGHEFKPFYIFRKEEQPCA